MPTVVGPRRLLAVIAVTAIVLAGCAGSDPGRPLAVASSPSALSAARDSSSHVVVIVMENKELRSVIGNPSARYINSLARRYASATAYYAVAHPSLPNYLALTGGGTFGINSDCTDCSVGASGIANQLDAAGVSWKAYMEDLPHACFTGASAGGYAKKHDPFIYYNSIAGSSASCARIVPFTQLSTDLRNATLPAFAWISPNLCDDMHDCSVAVGDRFLANLVPYVLARLGPHGVLALVWDEGTSDRGCCRAGGGGLVPLVLAGPGVRPGRYTRPADHYSLLRLFEDAFALPRLRMAACRCTPSLDAAFRQPPRLRAR
jgi:hypothetical protein